VEYEGDDPLALVNSLNLSRDLTGGQRAMVAARQWLLGGDKSVGGRPAKGKPSQSATVFVKQLARQFRTSDNSISQARDLLAEAPDLAAQVERCDTSLVKAHEKLQERRHLDEDQRAHVAADLEPFYADENRKTQQAQAGRGMEGGRGKKKTLEANSPQGFCRPERAPQSRDQAAAAVDVKPRKVQEAKAIKEKAPDLHEKVKARVEHRACGGSVGPPRRGGA
jgi:hypothetical protein